MTTAIALGFPFGRYHATPWGRAVNEAVVEWPPSPWRLLRALYATWRSRAPDLTEAVVLPLLERLAVAPSFRVPRYTEAHTRHYMPDISHGTDKALDPFTVLDPDAEVIVRWPADLEDGAHIVLTRLCSLLPYLGRAESICEARVLDRDDDVDGSSRWLEPGASGDLGQPAVRVLVPAIPLDVEALVSHTSDVRRAGRLTPRGARWETYPAISPDRPPAVESPQLSQRPLLATAVRLRLAGPVLPSFRDTVLYGHTLRRAVMDHYGEPSPTLSGRNPEARLDGHRHAHYIGLDSDGDRLLDTIVAWAPDRFDEGEVRAFLSIRRLTSGVPGFRPVRAAVEAVGSVASVAPQLCGPARRWRTASPFAPYRHQKRQGVPDYLKAEVNRELTTRGLPAAVARPLLGDWLSFRRQRPGKGADMRALGIELEFAEPIDGPLALGALSHFGLGLFLPST